jgi:hypothetical protein
MKSSAMIKQNLIAFPGNPTVSVGIAIVAVYNPLLVRV